MIALAAEQENELEALVQAGRFASMEEAVSSAVTLLLEDEEKLRRLRQDIDEGFASGDPVETSFEQVAREARAEWSDGRERRASRAGE